MRVDICTHLFLCAHPCRIKDVRFAIEGSALERGWEKLAYHNTTGAVCLFVTTGIPWLPALYIDIPRIIGRYLLNTRIYYKNEMTEDPLILKITSTILP